MALNKLEKVSGNFSQTSVAPAAVTAGNPAALTAAALTDNSGGSDTPDGTIAVIADGVLSTGDTYTDAAVLATVDAIVDDCANAVEECAAQINKIIVDITAIRAEVVKLVTDAGVLQTPGAATVVDIAALIAALNTAND